MQIVIIPFILTHCEYIKGKHLHS